MKRTAWLAFAFFCCSIASPSQSTTQSEKQLNFVIVAPDVAACPAVLYARHEGGLHRRVLVNGDPAPEPGLPIMLTLAGGRSPRITRATVTAYGLSIHGMNGRWQLLKAGNAHGGSGEISKTLDAVFAPGEDDTASSRLVLPGFTSVKSIELDSVSYADGSTWKPAPHRACQVAPDPFMPVDAQWRIEPSGASNGSTGQCRFSSWRDRLCYIPLKERAGTANENCSLH